MQIAPVAPTVNNFGDSAPTLRIAPAVNILGTPYQIILEPTDDDPKMDGALGYCEPYSKKIFLLDFEDAPETVERSDLSKMSTLRHEIIHAFLHESGLSEASYWAMNEEMVDWFALQMPKLLSSMMEAGAL